MSLTKQDKLDIADIVAAAIKPLGERLGELEHTVEIMRSDQQVYAENVSGALALRPTVRKHGGQITEMQIDSNLAKQVLGLHSSQLKQRRGARRNLSRQVATARVGKPVADIDIHQPQKNRVRFGTMAGKLDITDEALVGPDPDIQALFLA